MTAPVARSVESEPLRATEGPQKGSGKSLPITTNEGVAHKRIKVASKPVASTGKSTGKSLLSDVVTDNLPLVGNLFDKARQIRTYGQQVDGFSKGWRLEQAGKYWQWRWQSKDANGNTITYQTKSGKKGYKRGSQYVGKNKPKRRKRSAK